MSSVEDIEGALRALWQGKTGATTQAVMRQPALMSLEYVANRARQQSGVDQPSREQIAEACRICISEACGRWANIPTGPDIARDLLGVTGLSVGKEQRVRRERVTQLYGVSMEWLVHKRKESPDDTVGSSNETRAIEVAAGAMADSERAYRDTKTRTFGIENLDFVVPAVENGFRCLAFETKMITVGATHCVIERILHLVSLRNGSQFVEFHDGWGSTDVSFFCEYYGPPKGWPLGHIGQDAMTNSVLPLNLRQDYDSGEELDLRLVTTYDVKDARWGEVCDYSLGFFVHPGDLPTRCSLSGRLPDSTKARVQIASHLGNPHIEEEEQLKGASFQLLKEEVLPGQSYTLHWQMTPLEPQVRIPDPESNYDDFLDDYFRIDR